MKLKIKLIAALAVSLTALETSTAQTFTDVKLGVNTINTTTTENLKGKVESVIMTTYYTEEQNGTITKGSKDKQFFYEYNSDGLMTSIDFREISVNDKGFASKVASNDAEEFIYDANNKCIGKKYYDATHKLISESKCMTDDKGNIIREINTTTEYPDYPYGYTYTYGANGAMTSFVSKDTDGILYMSIKYEYDQKNNPIKEISYEDMSGESERTFEYTKFDDEGNWIECIKDLGYEKRILSREIKYFE